MTRSNTVVIERNVTWRAGEPIEIEAIEAGWATEARYFVRILDASEGWSASLRVQISPDGMNWIDEGTALKLNAAPPVGSVAVTGFGHWLRLVGDVDKENAVARVIVYCNLKG